jgi:hypothetical protein
MALPLAKLADDALMTSAKANAACAIRVLAFIASSPGWH